MNELTDRYELPLFIVENGLGIDEKLDENNRINDVERMKYLKMHVEALKGAIEDGCDIIGYFLWWGPIDIVSAGTGEMKNAMDSSMSTASMMEPGHWKDIRKIVSTITSRLLRVMGRIWSINVKFKEKQLAGNVSCFFIW